MQEFLSEINYDKLINQHLKGVIKDALTIAATEGLPGENHFYITFRTTDEGVEIPLMLRTQYPETMTIVLQHQFANLVVEADKFSVDLMFGGIPYTLTIPYRSIAYFADPSAHFGLSFVSDSDSFADTETQDASQDSDNKQPTEHAAEVISIDRFRKK
jgi:hypothetical protein